MSEEPVGVVADTTGLWLCGASYLPRIGRSLGIAGTKLANTAADSETAYNRIESNPRGEFTTGGPVAYWAGEVRGELQNILRESVDNLFEMGDALEKIAWSYETTDGDNATGLRQDVADYLGPDEDRNDPQTEIWPDKERDKLKPPTAEETAAQNGN